MEACKKDRGSTWRREEVLTLINIWRDKKIQQQLDNGTRKKHVYEKIAQRLEKESRHVRSYIQIREKIKQLKQSCKKVKDNNNLSGRGRKTFEFYDQVDQIMGDTPITKPPCVLDTGEREPTEVSIDSDSETEENETQNEILDDESDHIVNLSIPVSTLDSPTSSSSLSTESSPMSTAPATAIAQIFQQKMTIFQRKMNQVLPQEFFHQSEEKQKRELEMKCLSPVHLEMMNKQQAMANDCFFKLEEARLQKEYELEEKRRREDKQHEVMMMQMMGNMFSQITAGVTNFPNGTGPQNNTQYNARNSYQQEDSPYYYNL
eukprot:gene1953-2222_t